MHAFAVSFFQSYSAVHILALRFMGRVSVMGIEPVSSGCFQDFLQVGTALKWKRERL